MKQIIDALNKALAMEIQAILQYVNQYHILHDADFMELANKTMAIAKEEMSHADDLGKRIKELGGSAVAMPDAKPTTGQGVEDIFQFDADLETTTIKKYNEFSEICRENGDTVSATLLERISASEQEHSTRSTR